jgi:hypothetical protein
LDGFTYKSLLGILGVKFIKFHRAPFLIKSACIIYKGRGNCQLILVKSDEFYTNLFICFGFLDLNFSIFVVQFSIEGTERSKNVKKMSSNRDWTFSRK